MANRKQGTPIFEAQTDILGNSVGSPNAISAGRDNPLLQNYLNELIVLLGTIILPPLGVFMELGIKGWLNILICALLTLLYYVPGLVYALILLYC